MRSDQGKEDRHDQHRKEYGVKLSIVIINWNDFKVLPDCLESIYRGTKETDLEVIISDNGSSDGSLEWVGTNYPKAVIVENNANLGFAAGNNAGIKAAKGEYILILNPDTIIHEKALDNWISWADAHQDAGAFGCRVLNADGSDQRPARPFPTVRGYVIAALYMRWLGRISDAFLSDGYVGWDGMTEREIDRQSGCCILFRGDLLRKLNGFDERFFYHFEETDLCYRAWKSGHRIVHCPSVVITHLGGQSVNRFPIRFAIETYRSMYKYFHKHFGMREAEKARIATLLNLYIRLIGYSLMGILRNTEELRNRLEMYKAVIKWNRLLTVKAFIEDGEEPHIGYEPLMPATETNK